eukprot:TRINITY_DN3020_c0_g1_i1.p1 TRINITY_DN3020_c0_g1~~TRINITY_DN3020_c0_g1_i1.p1  ORF type:complete len:726 (+),score=187.57 TRINITY_DN3020_c0_g1_i1:179-2356(+)
MNRKLERSPSDVGSSNNSKGLREWQPVRSPQQAQTTTQPSFLRTESLSNVSSYKQPPVGTSSGGKQPPPRPLRADLLEKFSVDSSSSSSPSNQQKRVEPKPPPRQVRTARAATESSGSTTGSKVGTGSGGGGGGSAINNNTGGGGGWTSGMTSNDRALRRRGAKEIDAIIAGDLNKQQSQQQQTSSPGKDGSPKEVDLEYESFKESMRNANRGKRRSGENGTNELAEVFAKLRAQKDQKSETSPTTTVTTTTTTTASSSSSPITPTTTTTSSITGEMSFDGKKVEASFTNKKEQMVSLKRMSRSTGSLPTESEISTDISNTEDASEAANGSTNTMSMPAQRSMTSAKEIVSPTEDGEYERLLQLAQTKDFSKLESQKMIYRAGVDKEGRPVVVLMMKNFVKQTDTEFLLLYFIFVMDQVVENNYVLVFCNTKSSGDNRPSFSWMRKAYSLFKRKYKKNLKALYIIHPNFSIKLVFKVFKPFVSAKFWKKLVYIEDLTAIFQYIERDQLMLPETVFMHNATIVKPKPMFGIPLHEVVAHYPSVSGLPPVVEKSIEYVLKRATHVEGIFRMSGTQTLVDELKRAFDRGEDVNLQKYEDIHTVASLLKLFLRDLPEPPFPFESYDTCIALILSHKEVVVEEWVESTRKIISGFPKPNYLLLSHLFSLLACCAQRSNENKMTSSNLAIVFGPTLLRPKVETPEIVFTHIPLLNNFVKLIIDHQHTIFTY